MPPKRASSKSASSSDGSGSGSSGSSSGSGSGSGSDSGSDSGSSSSSSGSSSSDSDSSAAVSLFSRFPNVSSIQSMKRIAEFTCGKPPLLPLPLQIRSLVPRLLSQQFGEAEKEADRGVKGRQECQVRRRHPQPERQLRLRLHGLAALEDDLRLLQGQEDRRSAAGSALQS